jgi:uncharacterized membrane protein YphA (DoxX/SURF4 family)
MKQKLNIKRIIASVARTLLGVVFIFSGFVKAVDPLGTVYKIEDYLKAFGGFFTDLLPLATAAAVGMIALEFVLGVCMLLNVRTKCTAWLAILFYLVMTPLTLYVALNNPVSDCGCFGDAIVISNWQTFWKNVILLTLALLLLIWRKEIQQLWSGIAELGILLLAIGGVSGVMGHAYTHLPMMDFRPYKVGNNIPELMEAGEADQYEYYLVYEKDGVEQTFTLTDYPKNDSTWSFVRQENVLIKEGTEAPIHDFEIITSEGDDITWDILESENPVTLIIMYDLVKADKQQMEKVHTLYENCYNNMQQCYILTGSGTDEIIAFNLEYPALSESICSCDPVTLKTIVRANPGVIVVQNGTVIDKYNIKNRN